MRKIGLIILTFVYIAFTAGVSLQRHYCMNRMTALRFSSHPEDRCGFCGMEKTEQDNSCCRDEPVVYKITDDQQPALQALLKVPDLSPLLQDHCLPITSEVPSFSVTAPVHDHGPPGISPVPLFIRFGVFRI